MFDVDLHPGERQRLFDGDREPLTRVLREFDPQAGGEAFDEAVATYGQTLSAPTGRLALRLRRGGAEQIAEGALGPALALTVADAGDGTEHLVLGTAEELPRFVAEFVDIGPRPIDPARAPIPMPYEPLDAFAGVGCGEDVLGELHRNFEGRYPADDLSALFDGRALRWTLTLSTDGSDEDAAELDVIDARDRGLWVIDDGPSDESVWVRPITSSELWVLLSAFSSLSLDLALVA